jgi:AcrR family transcriptional regulator
MYSLSLESIMSEIQTNSRAQKKEATRRRLVECALEQFALKGFRATPTADIAKAAGVAHGTVFVHFPTQEDLVTSVVEDFGLRVASRLHELVAQAAGLRQVLTAHLSCLEEFEGFYTRLVAEGRLLSSAARNTLVSIQSAISFHLAQAAEVETAQGLVRPLAPHLLFNTWMGLVHYYLAHGDLFAPDESVLRRHGPELIDHMLWLLSYETTKEVEP